MYKWRHIRLEFTQAMTNKAPVSPNRGYSRMQQLWFTERVIDIVAHTLGFDPVEIRRKNFVQPEDMPYETPNGCVYDSGDYPRAMDMALELVGAGDIEERRAEAASRGKLLGLGIGSTLDSGTNNFGQSQLINPDLQFSGNNEVATVKLDIFGEIVVTLGTTPQGQGHETTAAQVVADILHCDVDMVHVRAGHDSYWNSHAGFSGTYASQFAVTGLGAVKGAADLLAGDMIKLASMVFQCPEEAIELADGFARIKDNPEAALPFMALGAIPNANNAGFPEDPPTMNRRFVYRPPFEVPDKERKFGNLTLTYATQIHACVVEIDPETGVTEVVDYAAVDDCGVRINPQIVEGQVMGATAHAIGAALWESFVYDEDGNLLTPNFYDYHVPHALDMPPLKTAAIESPVAVHAARHEGHGRGRRRRHPLHLRRDPGCAPRRRRRDRDRQPQPLPPRLGAALRPGAVERNGRGDFQVNVNGTKELDASREVVWSVINDPAQMAGLMPGRRGLRDQGRPALAGEGEGAARPRRPEDDDRLREARGAAAGVRLDEREGQGRRRDDEHDDLVHAQRRGRPHVDGLVGRRQDRRAGRLDGPARPAADHQPAGRERAHGARGEGRRGEGRARRRDLADMSAEPIVLASS